MGATQTFQNNFFSFLSFSTFQNKPTDHLQNWDSPAAKLSHWGQASSRKQSECGRHGLSNILQKYKKRSCIHQRAGKSNLCHMRGGRFHAGNTLCTFKVSAWTSDTQILNHSISNCENDFISLHPFVDFYLDSAFMQEPIETYIKFIFILKNISWI